MGPGCGPPDGTEAALARYKRWLVPRVPSRYSGRGKMRGVYVLLIEVKDSLELEVGKLGKLRLDSGFFAYVGSARGGIRARVERHLRSQKKIHWHIDYLLSRSGVTVREVYALETDKPLECQTARALAAEFSVVPGFGSSDCACRGHLFRCDPRRLRGALEELGFRRLELLYRPHGPAG